MLGSSYLSARKSLMSTRKILALGTSTTSFACKPNTENIWCQDDRPSRIFLPYVNSPLRRPLTIFITRSCQVHLELFFLINMYPAKSSFSNTRLSGDQQKALEQLLLRRKLTTVMRHSQWRAITQEEMYEASLHRTCQKRFKVCWETLKW